MSDSVDLWRRVADGFEARLDQVSADQLGMATPCDGWDVKALVEHALGAQMRISSALTGSAPEISEDLRASWSAIRAAAESALSQPGALEKTVEMPFGSMPAENALGIMTGDMLLHTWDLARATGSDDTLDQDACQQLLTNLEPVDAFLRSPEVFGPKLEAAPGASIQDQLLAFTGRRS